MKITSELYLYWYAPYDDMHVRVYLVYNLRPLPIITSTATRRVTGPHVLP